MIELTKDFVYCKEKFEESKSRCDGAVLLFRIGDFYVMFGEDADECSKILGISVVIQKYDETTIHKAGFPHRALYVYLPRLIHNGKRVAII